MTPVLDNAEVAVETANTEDVNSNDSVNSADSCNSVNVAARIGCVEGVLEASLVVHMKLIQRQP